MVFEGANVALVVKAYLLPVAEVGKTGLNQLLQVTTAVVFNKRHLSPEGVVAPNAIILVHERSFCVIL